MKGWINYDSKAKFSISLGLTLIFFGLIVFVGLLWVMDNQLDKYIDTQIRIMELGEKANQETVDSIYSNIGEKIRVFTAVTPTIKIILYTFLISGGILVIVGSFLWIKS